MALLIAVLTGLLVGGQIPGDTQKALASADVKTRRNAAKQLAGLETIAGLRADPEATKQLLPALADPDVIVRRAILATIAAASWDSASVRSVLEGEIALILPNLEDPDEENRGLAIQLVAMLTTAEQAESVFPAIIRLIERDTARPAIIRNAIAALTRVAPGQPAAVVEIQRLMAEHDSPRVRAKAARMLGTLPHPPEPAVRALVRQLQDEDPVVVEAAIAGLASHPSLARDRLTAIESVAENPALPSSVREAAKRLAEEIRSVNEPHGSG